MCVSSVCLFANLIVPRSWTKSLIVAGKKGGGGGGGKLKLNMREPSMWYWRILIITICVTASSLRRKEQGKKGERNRGKKEKQ